MDKRRVLASRLVAACAVVALAACGAPQRARTLDNEPDLARIRGTIPSGFSSSTRGDLEQLQTACTAIDAAVATQLPEIAPRGDTALALIDFQCEWINRRSDRSSGVPVLIIGLLDTSGGGAALDATTSILDSDDVVGPVGRVGDRAVFDAQTRTLYVLEGGRLWYLQLVGDTPVTLAPNILSTLGRALSGLPGA